MSGQLLTSMLTILDQVLIADGHEPRSRAFAGVQMLSDGNLLVGYREGSVHPWPSVGVDDGAIVMRRSSDGGRTWSEPRTVFALPGWDCSGGNRIAQLPDQSLLMFVFQARWCQTSAGPPEREAHVFPMRSIDGGRTWSRYGPELQLFSGWNETYAHGNILILSNGRWLLPVHGADHLGGTTYSAVAFSTDDGLTWDKHANVAMAEDINFYETDIIRLDGGRLLAVIRTLDEPFAAYQSQSADEGYTWTAPRPTGFYGETPRLFRLRADTLLCAYRDRDPARLGISYSVSKDDGETWQFGGQLYQARDWNCGYPDLVRLPGGEIFCVFYTEYNAGDCQVRGLFLQNEI